jgi:voltage-gated potassium channel
MEGGNPGHPGRQAGPYQVFILLLSVVAICMMPAERAVRDEGARQILRAADLLVSIVFLLDFVVCLVKSRRKWRYLYTWGWIDLLSSIPTIALLALGDVFPLLKLTRVVRALRIFRLLRGVRATRVLAGFILDRRGESAFLTAALVSILLVVWASITVLHVEDGGRGNITTAGDAVWWAVATITTVGYGDHTPVTTEGRAIGALLMISGVGFVGVFAAFLASVFLRPDERKKQSELDELRRDIAAIRRRLEMGATPEPAATAPDPAVPTSP